MPLQHGAHSATDARREMLKNTLKLLISYLKRSSTKCGERYAYI